MQYYNVLHQIYHNVNRLMQNADMMIFLGPRVIHFQHGSLSGLAEELAVGGAAIHTTAHIHIQGKCQK